MSEEVKREAMRRRLDEAFFRADGSEADIGDMLAELDRLEIERDAYKLLAEGQQGMIAAYRLGRRPSEAVFAKLEKARAALAKESTS